MDSTMAIVLRETGGCGQLRCERVPLAPPEPGELRIRQSVIGVNFHDCYVRSGLYRTLELPGIPGIDAVGVVEAVGEGVAGFAAGDRIACIDQRYGAYAERRNLPSSLAIRLPDAIGDEAAAGILLRGLTVSMLIHEVIRVQPSDVVLVHAAAGGVGQLLTQWCKHVGATVIGTVGSEAKAAIARANGADHVVPYRQQDFVQAVSDFTRGRGVDVAYDSVGKDTFAGSLQCLALRGRLVNFGQSSGPVEPLAMSTLAAKSLAVARPILFHFLRDPAIAQRMTRRLFDAHGAGVVRESIGLRFPLEEAARAHAALESRTTTGAVVLTTAAASRPR